MVYLRRRLLLLAAACSASALPRAEQSNVRPVDPTTLTVSAKAWNGMSGCKPDAHGACGQDGSLGLWPELELDVIASRPNAGIAFSGGGSRSFTVSLSYMAALRELGLMDKFRYMTGISGGSWATTVYAYANQEYCCPRGCLQTCEAVRKSGRPFNVSRLLMGPEGPDGHAAPPATLTAKVLGRMAPGTALEGGTSDIYAVLAEQALELQGDAIWYKT